MILRIDRRRAGSRVFDEPPQEGEQPNARPAFALQAEFRPNSATICGGEGLQRDPMPDDSADSWAFCSAAPALVVSRRK